MSDSEGLNSEGSNGADQHRRIRDQSLLCTCSINRARHGNSHPRVTWDRVDQIFCRIGCPETPSAPIRWPALVKMDVVDV